MDIIERDAYLRSVGFEYIEDFLYMYEEFCEKENLSIDDLKEFIVKYKVPVDDKIHNNSRLFYEISISLFVIDIAYVNDNDADILSFLYLVDVLSTLHEYKESQSLESGLERYRLN